MTDWTSIVHAWSYVFDHLEKYGEFSLADLATFPKEVQEEWFVESKTLDLWMMFDKKPLLVQVANRKEETITDERERLLLKLMNENPRFMRFEGCKLYTEFDHRADPFIWYQTKMTPFKMLVQEDI